MVRFYGMTSPERHVVGCSERRGLPPPSWKKTAGASPAARSGRPAYTLLEVLLAASIGLLLMGALYVAVDMQLRLAQTGRDVVEQGTVARVLLNRIGNDIASSLGPPDPNRFRPSSSQGSNGSSSNQSSGNSTTGSGATSGSTSTTSTSTTSSNSSSSSSSSPSSSSSGSGNSTNTTNNYIFSLQGTSSQLTLYISRLPRFTAATETDTTQGGDLRRVTYWLASNGGLARQELWMVTSDDAAVLPPDIPNEDSYVEAPEVQNLTFSYFDGTSWQDSWDGTATGSDGVTPIGPPMAVAIIIDLAGPGGQVKTYRHVVSLLTANGPTVQQNTTGQGASQTSSQSVTGQ